ncbi:MAG: DUF6493 family protein [Kibdelosporangium sp.]
MTDWEQLEKLLRAGEDHELIRTVRDLGEHERKALLAPAKQFERRARDFDEGLWNLRGGLAVIGAGVLPGASTVAPWLVRNRLWTHHDGVDLVAGVVEVLRARAVPWLPDLARRLAQRLPTGNVDGLLTRLVTDLVTVTGIDPPPTDGLVLAWATFYRWGTTEITDPRWVGLVPRLFEVTGVGRAIDASVPGDGGWPKVIAELAAAGQVDRLAMIDAAIGALQRGGRLGDVRGYLRVYQALAPGLPEIVDRVRDYVPLLADAHSSVAGVAQQELFRADAAGSLDFGLLLDSSRAVFYRSEKKLLRAQLDRLKAVIKREPGRTEEVLGVLAALFDHEAADIQAAAVNLVVAHAEAVSQETRAELAAAASGLPADLRGTAAKALGAVDSPEQQAIALPSVPDEQDFPPIKSLAELLEELATFQAQYTDAIDVVTMERVLAGLVAFAYEDRDATSTALEPFFAAHPYMTRGHRDWSSLSDWESLNEYDELRSLIGAAVAPCQGSAATPYPLASAVVGEAQWRRRADQLGLPGPQAALVHRVHEISVGLAYAPRPMLVSAPTRRNGLIAPEVLLDRLSQAAEAGWEPWEHDLTQALLRLPDERDPALAARAAALGTAAGKRLARRLTSDDPIADVGLLGQLLTRPGTKNAWYRAQYFAMCWPAMLPAHSEVIAGHVVPFLEERTLRGRGGGRTLTALSKGTRLSGENCARAFAHGLDAHDKNDRAEAVDALLVLAGRGQWDGSLLGQQIGRLAAEGTLSLGRVVPCLRDLAQSGAAVQVWDTLAAAIPLMLSPALDRAPQRLADLLALGVELVEQVQAAGPIPSLAALASRRGSSRIVVEARRLAAALA